MASILDMVRREMGGFKVKQPSSKKDIDLITSQATVSKPKADTTSRLSASDKIGPKMDRGTSGLKDTLGAAMANTSMRLADKKEESKAKPKASVKALKDTSDQYWSPDGSSGDIGSASGEIGADMGRSEKVGGYDPDKGMKKGGRVSSASKRADGCAVRGKTRA